VVEPKSEDEEMVAEPSFETSLEPQKDETMEDDPTRDHYE